jgi:hypothetical protein
MVKEQYERILPFRDVIVFYKTHGIFVGGDLTGLKSIYEELSGDKVNTGCGGCVDIMLLRSYDLIDEYEKGKE